MKIGFSNLINHVFKAQTAIYSPQNQKNVYATPPDTFQKKEPETKTLKEVTIKDNENNPVNARIDVTIDSGYKKYSIYVEDNKNPLGYATTREIDYKKGLHLSDLYTEPHRERKYKGAGSELLKCVVEDSIERGQKGRVYAQACHVPPPYAFYYKNNFKATCPHNSMYNAITDYTIRNNEEVDKALIKWGSIEMQLDEKGALALLEGKRLYETRDYEVLGTKQAYNSELEAVLIEAPNKDEHYFLIFDKKAKKEKTKYTADIKTTENINGEKISEISDINDWLNIEGTQAWVEDMLNLACEKAYMADCDEIKNVTIKDLKGNPINTTIKRTNLPKGAIMCGANSKPVKFEMDIKSKTGTNYYATAHGTKDTGGFYLEHLFTDEIYNRQCKGAGSELLKCVVEESKKRGMKGKVNVGASNFPPPFAFYYKNNFKVISNQSYCNAAIDYAIRKGISATKVLDKHTSALPMQLDEKGADDFLIGKRNYLEREFKTIETKDINNQKLEANLIQAPDGLEEEYYLQIIDESKEELKQKLVACIKKETDENGEEYLRFFNVNDNYATYEAIDFARSAAESVAKELKVDKFVFDETRRQRRKH